MKCRKYTIEDGSKWDELIRSSRNGYFQFLRTYVEYHKERFEDHSLLFIDKNKLVACIPLNIIGKKIYSHQGISFGGVILDRTLKYKEIEEVYAALQLYIIQNDFAEFTLNQLPTIYHSIPTEEINYLLSRLKKNVYRFSKLSSIIDLGNEIQYNNHTSKFLKKYSRGIFDIRFNDDIDPFYTLLAERLKNKYNSKPVHSLNELEILINSFPSNIEIVTLYKAQLKAGALIFKDNGVIKLQYLTSVDSDTSRILLYHVIERYKKEYRYFDLGTSHSLEGGEINIGNLAFKESLGGRGVTYNSWTIKYKV